MRLTRQIEAPGEYTVTRTQMRDIIQRDLAYLSQRYQHRKSDRQRSLSRSGKVHREFRHAAIGR